MNVCKEVPIFVWLVEAKIEIVWLNLWTFIGIAFCENSTLKQILVRVIYGFPFAFAQ